MSHFSNLHNDGEPVASGEIKPKITGAKKLDDGAEVTVEAYNALVDKLNHVLGALRAFKIIKS